MTTIAVASERRPKVDAVRRAVARLAVLDPQRFGAATVLARAAPSGVRATPLSDDEMRRGARQRAQALRAALHPHEPAALYLGLEGGLHVEAAADSARVWLRSWAYCCGGGREAWGAGPTAEVPARLAQAVLRGEDLAAAIDRVTGEEDVRSQGGTWGYVTRGLIDRTAAFEAAVLAALAPFYNARAYE